MSNPSTSFCERVRPSEATASEPTFYHDELLRYTVDEFTNSAEQVLELSRRPKVDVTFQNLHRFLLSCQHLEKERFRDMVDGPIRQDAYGVMIAQPLRMLNLLCHCEEDYVQRLRLVQTSHVTEAVRFVSHRANQWMKMVLEKFKTIRDQAVPYHQALECTLTDPSFEALKGLLDDIKQSSLENAHAPSLAIISEGDERQR